MDTLPHRSFHSTPNGSRPVISPRLPLLALPLLAFFAFAACDTMLLPNEDMRYDNTKPVLFAGGATIPSATISLEAWNPATDSLGWEDIGTFTTDKNKWPTWWPPVGFPGWPQVPPYCPPGWPPAWPCDAYPWFGSLSIPAKYWGPPNACARAGSNALVRARIEGGSTFWNGDSLFTVRGDVVQCFLAHPWTTFYQQCGSSEFAYAAWVRSLDYRDFGKECAAKINEIRATEGKSALQVDEAGECDADSDAKCNYEWEEANCGATNPMCTQSCSSCSVGFCCAHRCPGSGAQNECSFTSTYSSIDGILSGCLWQQMYLNELACYKKNPPSSPCGTDGCYYDKACLCGHYVNMVTCDQYSKVSCGLYKTPSGGFKSVQEFF